MANKILYNQLQAPHQSALLKFDVDTNTWSSFASTSEANTSIQSYRRYIGLQVMVSGILHHYKTGILDGDLLPISGGVVPISGVTGVNFTHEFTGTGILREAVFFADAPGSFTLRQNEDPDTDFTIFLGTITPRYHFIGLAFYSGAKIQILDPTRDINYSFYIA